MTSDDMAGHLHFDWYYDYDRRDTRMDHRIMMELTGETKRAIAKHGHDGVREKSWSRAANILSEESGEVAKAVLETYDDGGAVKAGVDVKVGLQRIYDEALETASVAIRIMERCRGEAERITRIEEEVAHEQARQAGKVVAIKS